MCTCIKTLSPDKVKKYINFYLKIYEIYLIYFYILNILKIIQLKYGDKSFLTNKN